MSMSRGARPGVDAQAGLGDAVAELVHVLVDLDREHAAGLGEGGDRAATAAAARRR